MPSRQGAAGSPRPCGRSARRGPPRQSPQVRAFHDELLAPLKLKDRAGALLKTLEAYLSTNGSPTDAALRLHLHRNTVLYRLSRIQEILGLDLRDPDVRLSLHLALKISHVLETQR